MSHAWAGGSTRAWRRTRGAVLVRDNWLCQLQLDGCEQQADQVHHLKGKRHGDDPNYLVASCGPCNRKVGNPEHAKDPPNEPITRW